MYFDRKLVEFMLKSFYLRSIYVTYGLPLTNLISLALPVLLIEYKNLHSGNGCIYAQRTITILSI